MKFHPFFCTLFLLFPVLLYGDPVSVAVPHLSSAEAWTSTQPELLSISQAGDSVIFQIDVVKKNFREHSKRLYGAIETANIAWKTNFPSFDKWSLPLSDRVPLFISGGRISERFPKMWFSNLKVETVRQPTKIDEPPTFQSTKKDES